MASSSANGTAITPIEIQNHKKALMQCVLLEMGILFHSVFIGMALSVAVGNDFIVLLIAITFHRKFPHLPNPTWCEPPWN
jgi:zinc transporter 1/2/3